jgi:hypothetical protein
MQDTTVSDDLPPVVHHAHLVRNVLIGAAVAGAGWAIGVTQLNTSTAPKPTCDPQNPKCR